MAAMKESVGSLRAFLIYILLLSAIVAAVFFIKSQLDINIEVFASWHLVLS